VRQVRGFLRKVLAGRPRADDAVTVGSELAANACLHSRSGLPGGVFTVQAEVSEGDHLYVAVLDDGGPWQPPAHEVEPRHGLDLVRALAGARELGHRRWLRRPPGLGQAGLARHRACPRPGHCGGRDRLGVARWGEVSQCLSPGCTPPVSAS
jgi:hypothetical protein